MDRATQVIFVLAHHSVWVWQVWHDTNMVKWLSDRIEAQKPAVCLPKQAWHLAEPAQVGLGCLPRIGARGAWCRDGELVSPRSSPRFNRARWPQFGASLPGCAPSHAFVPLQIKLPGAVTVRWKLLCWLKPSLVVYELPAITHCSSPLCSWMTKLTVFSSKQKNYRKVTLAILLQGYEMLII